MEDHVFVMFDEHSKVLIPINQGVFLISQFKSEKKLNRMYSGNWILYPDGVVKTVKRVQITGYYGDTFWSKLLGALNSTHNILVELEEIHPNLDELIDKAKTYLQNDLASGDPYMNKQAPSELTVEKIISSKQLYSALSLPSVEDCLDAM